MWLILAVLSYLMQAVTGSIDRIIVHKEVNKPIVISFWVALFSVLTIFIPLVGFLPLDFAQDFKLVIPDINLLVLIILVGALNQVALLFIYKALVTGEATRISSIVGAITPIVTLTGAYIILNERLDSFSLLGFLILILGTLALTINSRSKKSDSLAWIKYALATSLTLGAASVLAKSIFDQHQFISAYSLSALGALVYVIVITVISSDVRQTINSIINKKSNKSKKLAKSNKQAKWIMFNALFGGLAIIILNLAIDLGSPSLVNALRGIQFAGIFVIAILLSKKHPKLLDEKLDSKSKKQKFTGIVLVVIGIFILANLS